MEAERMRASTTIDAPPETVFAILADPTAHPAIDGTGWLQEAVDPEPLTEQGQVFRMSMYHDNHPDKNYEMANEVTVVESPTAIAWRPGQRSENGELGFGGWTWRYDLTGTDGGQTDVTLTYDWSEVPEVLREQIQFPPFGQAHLANSLQHLATIATTS
jgi:uncharacterized protein YndB with AHSA1/START domain